MHERAIGSVQHDSNRRTLGRMTTAVLHALVSPGSGNGPAGQSATYPPVLIRDVRLFDEERAIPWATVVLADGHIRQVAPAGTSVEAPPGPFGERRHSAKAV